MELVRTDLQEAMDHARSIHRANVEGIRSAILTGELDPASAARWITADVETCITTMLNAVHDHLGSREGFDGGGAILGMGKLGGRELTLGADVDLMFVCEAEAEAAQLDAVERFHRVAQILVSALAWNPDAGRLYDVDMRLRPYGADGPLAVLYSSFIRYYRHDRWTWELQALTRARVIGDDSAFGRRLATAVAEAITHGPPPAIVFAEVAQMRRTLAREQPARGPWDIKRVRGGLTDLEFIVQAYQLAHASSMPGILQPNTGDALLALEAAGLIDAGAAASLLGAWRLYSTLRQLQAALDLKDQDLERAAPGHKAVVLNCLGAKDWPALRARFEKAQADVRRLFRLMVSSTSARVAAA